MPILAKAFLYLLHLVSVHCQPELFVKSPLEGGPQLGVEGSFRGSHHHDDLRDFDTDGDDELSFKEVYASVADLHLSRAEKNKLIKIFIKADKNDDGKIDINTEMGEFLDLMETLGSKAAPDPEAKKDALLSLSMEIEQMEGLRTEHEVEKLEGMREEQELDNLEHLRKEQELEDMEDMRKEQENEVDKSTGLSKKSMGAASLIMKQIDDRKAALLSVGHQIPHKPEAEGAPKGAKFSVPMQSHMPPSVGGEWTGPEDSYVGDSQPDEVRAFDLDKDGELSYEEVLASVAKDGLSKKQYEDLKKMFNKSDHTRNGKIDFRTEVDGFMDMMGKQWPNVKDPVLLSVGQQTFFRPEEKVTTPEDAADREKGPTPEDAAPPGAKFVTPSQEQLK